MSPQHADQQDWDQVASRLQKRGAFALLLVDAACLSRVEQQYGDEAYQRAMEGLFALVRELVLARASSDDVLVTVEPDSDEILAFLFDPHGPPGSRSGVFEFSDQVAEELARHAGRAVYPYHRDVPNLPVGLGVAIYNPSLKPQRQIRQALVNARHDAELQARIRGRQRRRRLLQIVLSEELDIRFEQIVELRSGDVVGYEALARGPEGSEVHSPQQIFGLAEEMGLLFELDSLCRHMALERASTLPRGKKLFLNCLPTAIRDPSFRNEGLRKILEKLQLPPGDLVLEISEKESIGNFAMFREMRDAYRELGVQIAIDDAGVGYASLEAIMEVAPDFVKADIALVRGIDSDPPRQEALRALNAMAHRLDARVIAEGIETEDELRTLRDLGIPYGQGFFLGRPYTGDPSA
jgi:EAL domain-containing protein (putative c-di-GMP-specific phosphodiesterase class I)